MKLVDADIFIKDLTAMKSMYDAISLDGMIKALKEAPNLASVKQEWISVKDRLPEQYSFVLSFNGLGVGEAFFDGWRFLSACEDEPLSTTHWMPLPEPPKGEEK